MAGDGRDTLQLKCIIFFQNRQNLCSLSFFIVYKIKSLS